VAGARITLMVIPAAVREVLRKRKSEFLQFTKNIHRVVEKNVVLEIIEERDEPTCLIQLIAGRVTKHIGP